MASDASANYDDENLGYGSGELTLFNHDWGTELYSYLTPAGENALVNEIITIYFSVQTMQLVLDQLVLVVRQRDSRTAAAA